MIGIENRGGFCMSEIDEIRGLESVHKIKAIESTYEVRAVKQDIVYLGFEEGV